jgi:hypothetical protein
MQESTLTTEHVLREARVDTETMKRSLEAYRRHVDSKAIQPAGWHGASDIVTLTGLGGKFFWAEKPLQPANMTFTFDPGHVGSRGTYKIERFSGGGEHGVFYSVPNNPAIGWAFIGLFPSSGPSRMLTVAGMFTDNAWNISVLILNETNAQGPVEPPFSALRVI